MSSALEQKLRRELKEGSFGREPGRKADAFTQKQDLEALEEGKDLSAETAQRLQNRMGNQALNNIMGRNSPTNEAAGLSVEMEEEQGQEQQAEEELGDKDEEAAEHEETQRSFGGSGGGGGGGAAGDPWDMEHLFGGDDDDDGSGRPVRRRRMRGSPIRNFPGLGAQDLLPPRPEHALAEEDLEGIERGLHPLAGGVERWGDAIFQAVEPALVDPRRLGRRTSLEPEDLVDATGVMDPLGRPAEIGRFLSLAADGLLSRSLARVLGGPAGVLLTPVSGHAGAAARLASLAVSAEALEGGGLTTDRAVAVALRHDAWPAAMQAASNVDAFGRLRAPQLLAALLGGEPADEVLPASGALDPTPIGGRALEAVIPSGRQPAIPELALREPEASPEEDELVLAVDAVLARLTGGADASDLPPDPQLSAEQVGPVLEAATGLVNALSRTQVELTAAALAVRRVHPRAPVRGVLVRADEGLANLARAVVGAGRRLERLVGQPTSAVRAQAVEQVGQLREATRALGALRVWALSTLGGAVAA